MGPDVPRRFVCVGEKGASDVEKTKRGTGSKWMVLVDDQGIPLGIHVTSATPAEVSLVDATLKTVRVPRPHGGAPRRKPRRIVADRAYDSDLLRGRLAQRGITLIVPYRKNRETRPYEDGRHLRRLLVRHERIRSMYRALLCFAAALIALRRF